MATTKGYYCVVAWHVKATGTQKDELESAVRLVFEGRETAEVYGLTFVRLAYRNESHELFGALAYLAEQAHTDLIHFVMSPALPTGLVWPGYADVNWAAVNAITKGSSVEAAQDE